ncbi:MAG: VWA domain-containing protein [Alistipes sp.]|nr:VWA domain-containing protein [Alistipes sp.]
MKNKARIVFVLLAALCVCGCGIRSQKNASRVADAGESVALIELTGYSAGHGAEGPDGSGEEPSGGDTAHTAHTIGAVVKGPYAGEGMRPEGVDTEPEEVEDRAEPPIMWIVASDIGEVAYDMIVAGPASHSRSSTHPSARPGSGRREDIQSRPGTITAGEWNDADNWSLWQEISAREEFARFPSYWEFYCDNRVSVMVTSPGGEPRADARVRLLRGETELYSARTDNSGRAELWVGLTQRNREVDYGALSLEVDGKIVGDPVKPFGEGINRVSAAGKRAARKIDVAFVVDATGSMGDELEYLKTEMVDVIRRVREDNPGAGVRTSAVFYRDVGDEYITRVSDFTHDADSTADFIRRQYASGGGDYPEAVHTALEKATGELGWSDEARTRIMFLLLDAPPHHRQDVIASLHVTVPGAARMGIRIVPIVASGIDKETEFLMRYFALATGGTYIFLTDHSGVGNPHLEPSIGEYQVEYLNDAMVRLINKYSR